MSKLIPTPQARDWKGAQGQAYKNEAFDLPSVVMGIANKEENQGNPVEQLSICSQPGSRNCASQHPVLDRERAQKMTDGSGLRCLRRFEKLNHAISCWKTCLVSCLLNQGWYSSSVVLTWKLKGTRFNRCLFQLAVSTPRTGVNGCGLWGILKTPSAVETEGGIMEIRAGVNARYKLRDQIAMLPTLTSRDHKSEKCSQETYEKNARPLSETIGMNTGMQLQPGFALWMMGYPKDWCDLNGK